MTDPVAVPRQATFNTEPADSVVSGGSIRRGNVELPVVDSDSAKIVIPVKKKTADKNNNDSDCVNANANHYNTNDSNNITTINIESDTDLLEDEVTQDQSIYNNNNNSNNQPKISQPRSNQSSPIYGSKSAYEKFNRKYRVVKRTPSVYDDSSDLDILSDVGIADDSDCDVIPVVTPLSLSARRKTRKEPRIKVPSSKVDNTEPTIQEETTQDILNVFSPELTSGLIPLKSKSRVPDQVRSQTVIVEKDLKTIEDKIVIGANYKDERDSKNTKRGLNSKNLQTNSNSNSISNSISTADGNDQGNAIKFVHNGPHTLSVIKDELESSFCESDWQPRKSETDEKKTPQPSSETAVVVAKDKKSIIKEYDKTFWRGAESDKEPFTAREAKVNGSSHHQIDLKRPRSAGDKPKPKPKHKETVVVAGNPRPSSSKKLDLEIDLDPADLSRPPTRSAAPTPVISNFLEETAVVESSPSSKKSPTVYSGVPRRSITNTRDTLPKDARASNQFLTPPEINLPVTMETSDGYDYESETFEDILQERNAMVKAERTYQKRIKQLEEELKGMINQCQALSDENKELRKTIDSYKKVEKEKTEPKPDPGESTIELSARIAKLEAEKENLAKLNEKLSLSMKVDSNKTKQSEAVFVENTKLKNKNSELEKKVQLLNQDIQDLNSQLSEVHTANASGKSAVLEFKNKELEVAVDELKYENRGLVSKVKSLENEKHLITNSLEEKRIELNEMMRAMQNETTTETELKQSKVKLESAQEELDSVRQDLEHLKRMLKESESKKEKLQSGIGQRDSDIRRLRSEVENKDKIIMDLRSTNERLRGEIVKHEEHRNIYKEMEYETAALKSRIGSLKTEIESSLAENQRLKYEREEAGKEMDRLRNESAATADAIHESRKYFRKWETERESRNKAEVELAKKQDEVNGLHSSLKETGMKINMLYGRVRAAEEDKERFRGPNGQELETNNKILKDENKKLRQMLIERNIELANKTNEKEVLDNRVGILEKKQKDAEFRVRQLSGWVDSMNSNDAKPQESQKMNRHHSNAKHLPPRPSMGNSSKTQTQTSNQSFGSKQPPAPKRTGVKEPIIAVISPRSRKKRTAPSTMTPPPSWDDKGRYNNEIEGSNHTPLSLPLINESNKPRTPNEDFNGSYFHMYKERMKKVQTKRHAFD